MLRKIAALLPRAIQAPLRKALGKTPPLSGIYDAPPAITADGFASDAWCAFVVSKRKSAAITNHQPPPERIVSHALISQWLQSGKPCHVLDLGGGVGELYPHLTAGLSDPELRRLKWTVVDNERLCALGESMGDPIEFSTRLPPSADIALIIGTLQYIAAWQDVLAQVAALGVRDIVVGRHLSPDGEMATKYTIQNLMLSDGTKCGQAVVSLISRESIQNFLSGLGYRCVGDYPLGGAPMFGPNPQPLPLVERNLVFRKFDTPT